MSKHVRLITFDLDDTLWDARPALEAAEATQRSYLSARFPSIAFDTIPQELLLAVRQSVLQERPELIHHISLFREAFIKRMLESQGISEDESAFAAREAFAAFLSQRHQVSLFADAQQVLASLHRHFEIGALTNGNADVRKTTIGGFFDYAWRAEEFGISKPDPMLFHTAFAQAGFSPQEVIHVGDCHDNDVTGAASAGAIAVWFKPGGGVSDTASKVVGHLSELPDAIGQITA